MPLDFLPVVVNEASRHFARGTILNAVPQSSPLELGAADVLALLAAVLTHRQVEPAAAAFASELASRAGCERVLVGFVEDRFAQVVAVSHGALGGAQTDFLRAIGAAMDEAIDQGAVVCAPALTDDLPRIVLAHDELLRHQGGSVCTIPILAGERLVGAVSLMFRQSGGCFRREQIQAWEHAVTLVGPVLELMRQGELPWRKRWASYAARGWGHLWSPAGLRLRAGIGTALVGLAVLLFVPFDYRVGGNARLEGSVQRVLVAPVDGFLKRAVARPGDEVKAGQILVELAEQDLQLERNKWASEVAVHDNALSAAMARADRAQLVINQAKGDEARARLALVDEQLARIRVEAPFDGVVISGDLVHALGAPVQRGDVLMTVAPASRYRVIVEVDERDIGRMRIGQHGHLALSALPWDTLPIEITRITPMAKPIEGLNVFEVEATLGVQPESLRPGQRGVARILVGKEPLAWAWTHRLTEWGRVGLWGWLGL